ncbi:Microcystin-dependent protein [Candidatus Terasakiella magnetica]|nr:Microcystin-dependent protein [Candidatus Terasakiella magnetica]
MDAFFGEIRAFPYTFTPRGWHLCDGCEMAITSNQPLFAVIGYTYGGTVGKTFKLPNLLGRVTIDAGTPPSGNVTYSNGEQLGTTAVTLSYAELAAHKHTLQTQGSQNRVTAPSNSALMLNPQFVSGTNKYSYREYTTDASKLGAMDDATLQPVGGGGAHTNLSPYLVMGYYICVESDYFPVRP